MSIKLLKLIHHTVRTITDEEFFIVGGAVRDNLYGVEPKDYDCVLCGHDMGVVEAYELLQDLAYGFRTLGHGVKIYQSYGLNLGEQVNPTSFQAMFLGCMKVSMEHCELDILISSEKDIQSHVKRHDCNMNMVWFDGKGIQWEHGGNTPMVDVFESNPDVSPERSHRMYAKWLALTTEPRLN